MRIYFSPGQDPMLLDSRVGMSRLHHDLQGFAESEETTLSVAADQAGSSEPYSELLGGLEVQKRDGPMRLSLTDRRWLSLTGNSEKLSQYFDSFRFTEDEEAAHHHPQSAFREMGSFSADSLSLIVELDSNWIEELKG
jgi:hypothetical protein